MAQIPAIVGGGGSVAQPQSNLILAVSNSGSDTPTDDRPVLLYGGDYSAFPFATIQAAIDACERDRTEKVTIRVGAGSFAGFSLRDRRTASSFIIEGELATPIGPFTVASKINHGEFAVSAVAWDANAYRGYQIEILSGPGAGKKDIIYDNSANTIKPTQGATQSTTLGVGSVFQIVPIATLINSIPATQEMIIDGILLGGLFEFRNLHILGGGSGWAFINFSDSSDGTLLFNGCAIDTDAAHGYSMLFQNIGFVILRNTWVYQMDMEICFGTWKYDPEVLSEDWDLSYGWDTAAVFSYFWVWEVQSLWGRNLRVGSFSVANTTYADVYAYLEATNTWRSVQILQLIANMPSTGNGLIFDRVADFHCGVYTERASATAAVTFYKTGRSAGTVILRHISGQNPEIASVALNPYGAESWAANTFTSATGIIDNSTRINLIVQSFATYVP